MTHIIDFLFFLADPDGLRAYCIDDKLTGSQGCIRQKKEKKRKGVSTSLYLHDPLAQHLHPK